MATAGLLGNVSGMPQDIGIGKAASSSLIIQNRKISLYNCLDEVSLNGDLYALDCRVVVCIMEEDIRKGTGNWRERWLGMIIYNKLYDVFKS